MPTSIKVDNGLPLGDPNRDTPPVLALWLISLGIELIWNRPGRPQDNAKVERKQGVLAKWVEAYKCQSLQSLQEKLDTQIHFHNCLYPIRRLGNRTRLNAFPDLGKHTGQLFEPQNAQLNTVLKALEKREWLRKISAKGQVNLFNARFQIGSQFKHQQVTITLDSSKNHWCIKGTEGEWYKEIPTQLSLKAIMKLDLNLPP